VTRWRQSFGPSSTFSAGTIAQASNSYTVQVTFNPLDLPVTLSGAMVGGYLYYRNGGGLGAVTLPAKITAVNVGASQLTVDALPAQPVPAGTIYTIYSGPGSPAILNDPRGPGILYGQPCLANGVLYFGSYNGYLIALDACDGHVLFAQKVTPPNDGASLTPGFLQGAYVPVVVGGVLYLSYFDELGTNAGIMAFTA
jgi:hypothetical protein